MTREPGAILDLAVAALRAAEPAEKVAAAGRAVSALSGLKSYAPGAAGPPDRPARPERPLLVAPGAVPRRRLGTVAGRIALLHALAHIEFNAIDLAFDMAARFAAEVDSEGLDAAAFIADWIGVGGEEARHFGMLAARLAEMGAAYGDHPAHDGLWEAAESTRNDLLARLSVAPMALEARGLDVTPGMIERLASAGDAASADILRIIYADEVGHVAIGVRWFEAICAVRTLEPRATFRNLVAQHLSGGLKPPFNTKARAEAGFSSAYYEAV
ncbi:MAG: ferritin-like domain-containing protein [Amphiplicatus sp.]